MSALKKVFYIHLNPFNPGPMKVRRPFRGATIMVSPKSDTEVLMQATFCSKKDPFCKKTGREEAAKAEAETVNMRDVPKMVAAVAAVVDNVECLTEAQLNHRGHRYDYLLKNFI
jgi:hypothetical protein